MKNKIVGIIVCLLLIITVLPVSSTTVSETTFYSQTMENTLYVGGLGPNNYTTIQDAINDAITGDTIFVYDDSSPYYENIIIEKSITLKGENRATTVILGDESSDEIIVNISANDVSISGFTIQPNVGNPIGITVYKNYTSPDFWKMEIIQNVTISDNVIRNTSRGIFGIHLNKGKINGNNIENCNSDAAIYLLISSNNTITNNFVIDGSGIGILIDGLWSPDKINN